MQIRRAFTLGVVVFLMVFEWGCRSRNNSNSASDHPEAGIPLTLATERAETIRDVRYELSFRIPETVAQPIEGHVKVRFKLNDAGHPVVLDFEPGAAAIES